MDIAFHYFAVKTLAIEAGFNETDAQIIAQNSQMVDDFDFTGYWRCSNVPDYIAKHPEIYDLCVEFGFFNPAQTGFLCDGLLGYTDYAYLLFERFQKFTCVPFHFIPKYKPPKKPDGSIAIVKEYRVVPAKLDDGSIISELLNQAKQQYQDAKTDENPHPKLELMRIGVLLHIFADTVAHQMFSGYNAYVNQIELVNVINNSTTKYETDKYRTRTQRFLDRLKRWAPKYTPAIGHMMLEHIPDLTHLSFTVKYDGVEYTRDNTEQFIEMSKQILDYLCDCLGSPRLDAVSWQDTEAKLRELFKKDISGDVGQEQTVIDLKKAWECKFGRSNNYNYNGETLKKNFTLGKAVMQFPASANVNGMGQIPLDYLPSTTDIKLLGEDLSVGSENILRATKASEDFYYFNLIADEILIALYDPHPRIR